MTEDRALPASTVPTRQRIWEWLLPPEHFPGDEGVAYQKAASTLVLAFGGAILLAALAIVEVAFDTPMLGLPPAIAACAMVLLALPFRRGAGRHLYANAVCVLLYGSVLATVVMSGGQLISPVVALPALLLLTALGVERMELALWTAVAVLTALLSYVLLHRHVVAPYPPSPAWLLSGAARASIALSLVVSAIASALSGAFRVQQAQMAQLRELERSRRAELDLERARLADFALIAADWFWETDAEHRLVFVSKGFAQLFGLEDERMLGLTPLQVAQSLDPRRAISSDAMGSMLRREPFVNQRLYARKRQGLATVLNNSGRPVFDAEGQFHGFRGAVVDITETFHLTKELRRLADSDPLTGLANRRCLRETLDAQLRQEPPGWLLALDLDHFKEVNDAHGHEAGDRLLVEVARILRECVRGDDLVARMGGDEFAVLLPGGNQIGAETVAARILKSLAQLASQQHAFRNISASIGLTALTGVVDTDTALIYADGACYLAKRSGRGRYMLAGD